MKRKEEKAEKEDPRFQNAHVDEAETRTDQEEKGQGQWE